MLDIIEKDGKQELFRFLNVKNVQAVILPDTINQLNRYAFSNKDAKKEGLRIVYLPYTITEIPAYCFAGSPVEYVIAHPGIKHVGECAFKNCKNLISVKLPGDCTFGIKKAGGGYVNGETVFEGCPKLRKKFQPWIETAKTEFNNKISQAVFWQGCEYLQFSEKLQALDQYMNILENFEEQQGFYLGCDGKGYYRGASRNLIPTPRMSGPYTNFTRIIKA
jgi:hypothetical protein